MAPFLGPSRAEVLKILRGFLERGESWVPEMEWSFIAPGEPIAVAATAKQLAEAIEAMEWTYGA